MIKNFLKFCLIDKNFQQYFFRVTNNSFFIAMKNFQFFKKRKFTISFL